MTRKTALWTGLACLWLVGVACADAAYQETVQVTGGQLVESLRSIPFMPKSFKQVLDPMVTRTLLHGNQLVSLSKSSTQIIDLDRETITRIDNDKRTYSVTTFAQMRQALKDAPATMQEAQTKMRQARPAAPAPAPASQVQVTFEVAVTDPGVSKMVNGVMSKEQIMTMRAHVTDPSTPPDSPVQAVTYSVITEIWTAPEPAQMKEIDDFYVRYGRKLMQGVDVAGLMSAMTPAVDGSATAPLFAHNPGMGSAVQEMTKKMAVEMQKIKGTRILEITRIGGEAMTAPAAADAAAGAPPANGTVSTAAAGQVASDGASSAAAQQTSKLGALGSALGNSVLSAFHRNSPAAPAPAQAAAPGSGAGAAPSSAVLYETTTQKTDFSNDTAPAAAFVVPTGYTLVESAYAERSSN